MRTLTTILTTVAAALLLLTPAPATADTTATSSSASPYAFTWSPGCLALHTGRGIDGYTIDGLEYDVPNRRRVRTYLVSVEWGLQAEGYSTVARGAYAAAEGHDVVNVWPGDGCAAEGIVRPRR